MFNKKFLAGRNDQRGVYCFKKNEVAEVRANSGWSVLFLCRFRIWAAVNHLYSWASKVGVTGNCSETSPYVAGQGRIGPCSCGESARGAVDYADRAKRVVDSADDKGRPQVVKPGAGLCCNGILTD